MVDKGYFVEENVLSLSECRKVLEQLPSNLLRRGGIRHLMANRLIRDIANENRLVEIASRYLCNSAVAFKATLFNKTGKANWLVPWHQDTALPLERFDSGGDWGSWSTKCGIDYVHAPAWALERIVALRIQLDNADLKSGPLRVIEFSNKYGVLNSEQLNAQVRAGKERVLLTSIGGVIAMSPLLIHASSKAIRNKPRRVLHIEYADSLELGSNIRLAIA